MATIVFIILHGRGHYLFREANSFPRARLEENCELRGTDNVQGNHQNLTLCAGFSLLEGLLESSEGF